MLQQLFMFGNIVALSFQLLHPHGPICTILSHYTRCEQQSTTAFEALILPDMEQAAALRQRENRGFLARPMGGRGNPAGGGISVIA
ncbi:hypothetical protein D3C73_1527260 [compost metagenome]